MVRAWVSLCSLPALKKINTAVRGNMTLPLRIPMIPITTAAPWPIMVAMVVAWRSLVTMAMRARSTRPPSSGKAGSMLNNTNITLATNNDDTATVHDGNASGPGSAAIDMVELMSAVGINGNNTKAMATLTSGPAMAIHNSWMGLRGRRDR